MTTIKEKIEQVKWDNCLNPALVKVKVKEFKEDNLILNCDITLHHWIGINQ